MHLVQDNIRFDERNASHAVGPTPTMSGPQLTSLLHLQSLLQGDFEKIVTVCDNRGGERVSFLSPRFNVQSNISRKNVFVPWGLTKSYHFYQTSYSKEI